MLSFITQPHYESIMDDDFNNNTRYPIPYSASNRSSWLLARRRYSYCGFSLIELAMVIAIIGILTVIAMPFWPGKSIDVAAQADQLLSDLLYTRNLSLTTGKRYYWIKLSANTYQIRDSVGTAIIHPGSGSTTIILGENISFGTFTSLPNNLVAFDGKGTPYIDNTTPGTPLVSLATISVTAESTIKTVVITPTTGWIYKQ